MSPETRMNPASNGKKRLRAYRKSGSETVRRAVKERGLGRALSKWRSDLIQDLGDLGKTRQRAVNEFLEVFL